MSAVALAFCSCEHKDLCYIHPHTAEAVVRADWTDFLEKETPSGMTVMVYPHTVGTARELLSNDIEETSVRLLPDDYTFVVFNQSTTEFSSLVFTDMADRRTATVSAAARTSRWYRSRSDEEVVVTEPEWFGTAAADSAVTEEMADSRGRYVVAHLKPQNVVFTVCVTVHAEGISRLRSARASLTGLARGYMPGLCRPAASTATQLLESWSIASRNRAADAGTFAAEVRSFGLPYAREGRAADNVLTLTLLLVDATTTLTYEFPVGDAVRTDPADPRRLFIDVSLPEPLPNVRPAGSSGFDATVDDWGDDIRVDIVTQ